MADESKRYNVVSFSGGKDSTALLLWAKENLGQFEAVTQDTGWEHPFTYAYIEYINETVLDGGLRVLRSEKYEGFEDMAIKKKRAPSSQRRFCTENLKIIPMQNYIHSLIEQGYDVHNYVGIRADESANRAKMKESNFDLDYFGCWIHRPLLTWSADDVFDMHRKHGVDPNPLYKLGMKRVGCMPCIMVSHGEVRAIIRNFPDVIEKIKALEKKLGRTFFPPEYIPKKYRSLSSTTTKIKKKKIKDMFGERVVEVEVPRTSYYPTVDDVVKYLKDNPDQTGLEVEEPRSCMSVYNICE